MSLLYGAKDEKHNQAVVLKNFRFTNIKHPLMYCINLYIRGCYIYYFGKL